MHNVRPAGHIRPARSHHVARHPSRKIPFLAPCTLIKSAIAHAINFTTFSYSLPERQSKANLIIISSIICQRSRQNQWTRCHHITSWKLLISSYLKQCVFRDKLYWTITRLSTSDIVSLKDNALVQPNVFGSSAKVAHGIDRVVSAISKVLKTTVEWINILI